MTHDEHWEKQLPPLRRCRGFGPPIDPKIAERLPAPTPERETPSALQRRLSFHRLQAVLWHWVRRQMREQLTFNQSWSIRYHDLDGLSYAAAGAKLGIHASNVKRARDEGLRRLRELAEEENVSWDSPPPSPPRRIK